MAQSFDPLDTTGTGHPARQPADWSTYADQGFRYARWDGSQRLPDIHADDVLDALSDDLMEDGDIEDALMRLMRRGMPRAEGSWQAGMPGLDALRRRLAQQRKAARTSHSDDAKRALEVGVATWLGLMIGTAVKLALVLMMVGAFALAYFF